MKNTFSSRPSQASRGKNVEPPQAAALNEANVPTKPEVMYGVLKAVEAHMNARDKYAVKATGTAGRNAIRTTEADEKEAFVGLVEREMEWAMAQRGECFVRGEFRTSVTVRIHYLERKKDRTNACFDVIVPPEEPNKKRIVVNTYFVLEDKDKDIYDQHVKTYLRENSTSLSSGPVYDSDVEYDEEGDEEDDDEDDEEGDEESVEDEDKSESFDVPFVAGLNRALARSLPAKFKFEGVMRENRDFFWLRNFAPPWFGNLSQTYDLPNPLFKAVWAPEFNRICDRWESDIEEAVGSKNRVAIDVPGREGPGGDPEMHSLLLYVIKYDGKIHKMERKKTWYYLVNKIHGDEMVTEFTVRDGKHPTDGLIMKLDMRDAEPVGWVAEWNSKYPPYRRKTRYKWLATMLTLEKKKVGPTVPLGDIEKAFVGIQAAAKTFLADARALIAKLGLKPHPFYLTDYDNEEYILTD